jgi:hypothetical protein
MPGVRASRISPRANPKLARIEFLTRHAEDACIEGHGIPLSRPGALWRKRALCFDCGIFDIVLDGREAQPAVELGEADVGVCV